MNLADKLALVPVVIGGLFLLVGGGYFALVAWLEIGQRGEAAQEGREEWLP